MLNDVVYVVGIESVSAEQDTRFIFPVTIVQLPRWLVVD
jgi:hypothetical protein